MYHSFIRPMHWPSTPLSGLPWHHKKAVIAMLRSFLCHAPLFHTTPALTPPLPQVSSGTMKKAVILETKYPTQRKNGSHFHYLRNTCALLSEKGTPVGNRLRSMLSYEFLKPRWKRLSLLGKRLY